MAPSDARAAATAASPTAFVTDYDYSYEYDYDYGSEVCNKSGVRQFGAVFMPAMASLVVVLSLAGNVLVLVVLVKYENLKSLANGFILNLALSDLLFTAGLPFWAFNHAHAWTLGEPACKMVSFAFYLGFNSSGVLLILMTLHRYVAVLSPLSDVVTTTGSYSAAASALVWLLSVLASCPAFLFVAVDSDVCGFVSSFWNLWVIYQQNALFLLSAGVFAFCYSHITFRLLSPTARRRRTKTVKLIFVLMAVFFVGWVPYNVVIGLQSYEFRPAPPSHWRALSEGCERSKRLDYALYVARLFAYSHCCLNPFFYVFVGIKFKNHLKKLLNVWSGGGGGGSVRSRPSRLTITSVTSGDDFSL